MIPQSRYAQERILRCLMAQYQFNAQQQRLVWQGWDHDGFMCALWRVRYWIAKNGATRARAVVTRKTKGKQQ